MAQHPPEPRAVTVQEAADILRSSRTRVYALLSQGVLRGVMEGRRRLVLVESLDAYQEARELGAR